jgi:hypothetical protein
MTAAKLPDIPELVRLITGTAWRLGRADCYTGREEFWFISSVFCHAVDRRRLNGAA